MDFLYDESGNAYSFVYNGTQYYYVRNLQGDVIQILNTSGTKVVEYSYDAWGKCSVVYGSINAVANANPIRYRGYYYDTDTGFYYLQSRYYDPTIKRFINADSYINANGDFISFNMYAYCGNNPNTRTDISGESWKDVCAWVEDKWTKATNWFNNAKKWADKNLKNKDDTYSIYDNQRGKTCTTNFHEQLLVYDPINMEGEAIKGGLGEGGSITFITGGWEIPISDCTLDLSLFDFGSASLEMWSALDTLGLEVGVAIWSPSLNFETPKYTVEFGTNIGGAKFGFHYGDGLGLNLGIFNLSITS